MHYLYALTIDLDADRLDDLTQNLRQWVASKYARWDKEFVIDGTSLALGVPGDDARALQVAVPGGRYLNFKLAHPDNRLSGLRWHTGVVIATDGDATECTVTLATSSSVPGVLPPAPTQIRTPRFVRDLVAQYPSVRVGKEPFAREPLLAEAWDVGTLVDILTSKNRSLPLVLVASEATGEELVDPVRLQDRVLGLARVVRITPRASFSLSDRIGNRLSCYDGGVRIYWPGFSPEDDPYRHKLYLKWEIRDLLNQGTPLEEAIFERLTTTAIVRYQPGPLHQRLLAAAEKARQEEAQRLRVELAARAKLDPDDQALFDELLGGAEERIRLLTKDNAELENLLLDREAEVEDLRRQLQAERDINRHLLEAGGAPPAAESAPVEARLHLSARARSEFNMHLARQTRFTTLLDRLSDEIVRSQQASRCPGGGYVYPRDNSDERIFFDVKDGVVYVCALLPHHQDSLSGTYGELRHNGVRIEDFDGFEAWPNPGT